MGRLVHLLLLLALVFGAVPQACAEEAHTASSAEHKVITRFDLLPERGPGYSIGVGLDRFWLWGYDLNGEEHRSIEAGYLYPALRTHALTLDVGAFLADLEDHLYVEPWIEFHGAHHRLTYDGEVGLYVPMSHHGHRALHSHELFAGYRVDHRWILGLATDFYKPDGEEFHPSVGPEVRIQASKHTTLGLRWLHGSEGHSGRLELRRSF